MDLIQVDNVSKSFRLSRREKGLYASFKALLRRDYEIKQAVDCISFGIQEGEIVGYIGANGAGKSTTIKMLAGILVPTEGTISIDGRTPHLDRQANARTIGVVFGQRSQL
ncbi:MAG: ATP-binding cassette domain-containing protein, partial [Bacilli bacterium]